MPIIIISYWSKYFSDLSKKFKIQLSMPQNSKSLMYIRNSSGPNTT